MSVWLLCDRCRRMVAIASNEMPTGWVRRPLGWPGSEQDICVHCLTLPEQQALGTPPTSMPTEMNR